MDINRLLPIVSKLVLSLNVVENKSDSNDEQNTTLNSIHYNRYYPLTMQGIGAAGGSGRITADPPERVRLESTSLH